MLKLKKERAVRALVAITGVSFTTDKTQYHFIDKQRADLQKDLERRLPGYEVRMSGCILTRISALCGRSPIAHAARTTSMT